MARNLRNPRARIGGNDNQPEVPVPCDCPCSARIESLEDIVRVQSLQIQELLAAVGGGGGPAAGLGGGGDVNVGALVGGDGANLGAVGNRVGGGGRVPAAAVVAHDGPPVRVGRNRDIVAGEIVHLPEEPEPRRIRPIGYARKHTGGLAPSFFHIVINGHVYNRRTGEYIRPVVARRN